MSHDPYDFDYSYDDTIYSPLEHIDENELPDVTKKPKSIRKITSIDLKKLIFGNNSPNNNAVGKSDHTTNPPSHSQYSELQCQICLEDFIYDPSNPLQCTPCFHKYHRNCIFTWFREKYQHHRNLMFFAPPTLSVECPVCKYNITELIEIIPYEFLNERVEASGIYHDDNSDEDDMPDLEEMPDIPDRDFLSNINDEIAIINEYHNNRVNRRILQPLRTPTLSEISSASHILIRVFQQLMAPNIVDSSNAETLD